LQFGGGGEFVFVARVLAADDFLEGGAFFGGFLP